MFALWQMTGHCYFKDTKKIFLISYKCVFCFAYCTIDIAPDKQLPLCINNNLRSDNKVTPEGLLALELLFGKIHHN